MPLDPILTTYKTNAPGLIRCRMNERFEVDGIEYIPNHLIAGHLPIYVRTMFQLFDAEHGGEAFTLCASKDFELNEEVYFRCGVIQDQKTGEVYDYMP